MSCKFTVTFNGDINTVFNMAKAEAAKLKGSLEGTPENGRFHINASIGEFIGTYFVDGTRVTFELSKKPMFIPCGLIQSQLENQIEKYEREQGNKIA